MNEHVKATWNALDELAWGLGLGPDDTKKLLERNRNLMLTYVDIIGRVMVEQAREVQATTDANAAANGHKPVSSQA